MSQGFKTNFYTDLYIMDRHEKDTEEWYDKSMEPTRDNKDIKRSHDGNLIAESNKKPCPITQPEKKSATKKINKVRQPKLEARKGLIGKGCIRGQEKTT